jgi:uncharacterized membrane protein YGL010W
MLIPMKMTLEDFLQKYASDHQHPTNQKIHSICVPIIFWSIFAFADSISLTQRLSLGHLFGLIALAYYIQFKNLRLTFRMTLVIALCIGTATFIPHVQILAASAFAIAWVGQFYGHYLEGKRPSFFTDLQYLLIGPIWVMRKLALL